jgi:DNA transposition AAA+ family ATPase
VERLFGTLNTELLPELPGRLVRGKPATSPRLSLPELDAAIGGYITGTYHLREHRETGTAPRAAWLGDGWLPRMPGSLDDLDLLLVMVAKPRMVHRDGIHFQGLRYLAPALAAYIREPVTIRYDPRDITEIRVFHRNRSSAGRSVPSTPARPSPSKTSRPRVQRTAGPCAARSTSGSPGSPTSCPAPPLTRRRSSPRRSHGGQLPGCAPISKTPDDRQPPPKPRAAAFIATKEHRRFQEFACAVRRHRYIGLCYDAAGVGKTLSARRYARWDLAEPLLLTWGPREDSDAKAYAALASARTVFYTPTVGGTLRELREELKLLTSRADICIDEHLRTRRPGSSARPGPHRSSRPGHIELLIIDEAERLSATALEYLRDQFDRTGTGLVLIGMPGIEKRMARYPQLYSRVGFAHHYRPLQGDELSFVLTRHWRHLGLALDNADFTDSQAIAAIARITGGNFRLLHRLFVQIERILRINDLTVITSDVVEAARSTLVIGDAT